jgi:uncharacterized OsmC-like protein
MTLTLERSSDSNWKLHTGSAAMPVIDYDSSALTAEEKGNEHMGGRFMVAGALACYTNSLWNDVKRAAGRPVKMSASATVTKEKNDSMRTTFAHIELTVDLSAEELDDAAFERIRDALYRGSLVTYSLEEGVEFDYEINLVK